MFLVFQILFLMLCLESKKSAAFLNQAEKEITLALMKNLEIRHCIFVQDTNITLSDFHKFKNYTKGKTPSMFLSLAKLSEYFLKESYPDVNTLIVLKVPDIKIVSDFVQFLILNYNHRYYFIKFKWIVFINNTLSLAQERELWIPSFCLFFIAHQKDNDTYFLKEIYMTRDKIFSNNYGTWSYDSELLPSKFSIYERRFNLNNTNIIIASQASECRSHRECTHLQILKDFSKLMNFRLTWITYKQLTYKIVNAADIIYLASSYDYKAWLDADFVGPFFKVLLNWYIKSPDLREQSDYFIQPFNNKIWTFIFGILLIGSFCGMILYYSNKTPKSQCQLFDLVFMAFENLCNQDGFPKKNDIPHRIACFTLRFFALFIIPAYSGVLISFLAIRKPQVPFQTLQEFVEDGKYVIGARQDYYASTFFKVADIPLIKYVHENRFQDLRNSEVSKKFCNEPIALVEIDNDIYDLELECPFYCIKKPITYIFSAAILKKHSLYTRLFNYEFMKYYSSGIQKKMQNILRGDRKSVQEEKHFGDVTIYQIIQVLTIIPIGIALASIIFFCEIILYVIRNKSRGRIKKQSSFFPPTVNLE